MITCGLSPLHLARRPAEETSMRSARIHDVPIWLDHASGNRERQ